VKLLDSLLDAIVRLEGDALVMHVGEKPYVVTASSSMNAYRGPLAWGQVELSSRVLTFDAVSTMLGQILPADQQQALTEFGAIEHEIPSPAGVVDRFTVVAARGGEDVWVEVRRRAIEIPQPVAQAEVTEPVIAATPAAVALVAESVAEPVLAEIELVTDAAAETDPHPAANVQLDTPESIIVAIPGQAAQEFALHTVPENVIQIVDEEPQGVPTEEEVDAMLAATATALLTSGLAGEVTLGEDDEVAPPVAGQIAGVPSELVAVGSVETPVEAAAEAQIEAVAETSTATTEPQVVATIEPQVQTTTEPQVLTQPELQVEVAAKANPEAEVEDEPKCEAEAGPAFELTPPPLVDPVSEEPTADVETVAEPPVGLLLFSEEAMLAAAPAPELVTAAAVQPVPAEPAFAADTFVEPALVEQVAVDSVRPDVVLIEDVSFADVSVVQTPVGEVVPVVEVPAAAELPPFVEYAPPVDEAPLVVEHATPAETPQAANEAATDERVPSPELGDVEFVADVGPVLLDTFDRPAMPAAIQGPLAEASVTTWIAEPSVPMPVGPPAEIVEGAEVLIAPIHHAPDARVEVSELDAQVAQDIEEIRSAGVERPSLEVVVDTWNAGTQPEASEPTPPAWQPTVAERPMEVTPELQRQGEPVADKVNQPAASAEMLSPEVVEPVQRARATDEERPAVVVPLARTPIKPEIVSVPFTPSEDAALMHTLRVAAARGASTVYVVAQSKPMIRIDGEISPLESEPTLTAADVDRLVMELAPPRRRDALQNGPVEWLCDVPEIGRVRCLTFKDHRGPGVLFRMFPPRAISADQLALPPEVQALCQQSDGLVLVTGARASGKSTLLNAFVDLINRTRSDHLITIESQIGFVHESRRSFISQRETRGDAELAATFARAALREDPDVMVIDDLKSADVVAAALEAAESGRLVLVSVPASSTIGALERLIEVFSADRRAKARTSLATALRGVVAQVLLRRVKGGLVAAREILLNTPAVSQLVLEGKMFQLPVALDSGRRHGMLPLTDSLAAHVRDGTVHVAEAYRKALDRAALVALLKREGIDTSFAERLA
jgi:twitching motility protein PilT